MLPILNAIDIFSFIWSFSQQTNYIINFFLLKVLYLVYQGVHGQSTSLGQDRFLSALGKSSHPQPFLLLFLVLFRGILHHQLLQT